MNRHSNQSRSGNGKNSHQTEPVIDGQLATFIRRIRDYEPGVSVDDSANEAARQVISEHEQRLSDFREKVLTLVDHLMRERSADLDLINQVPIELSNRPYSAKLASGLANGAITVIIEYTPAARGFFSRTPSLLKCQLFRDSHPLGAPDTLQLSQPGQLRVPDSATSESKDKTWTSGELIERVNEFLSRVILVSLSHSENFNQGLPEADLSEKFALNMVREVAKATHLAGLPGYFSGTIRRDCYLAELLPLMTELDSFEEEWKTFKTQTFNNIRASTSQIMDEINSALAQTKELYSNELKETFIRIQDGLPSEVLEERAREIARLDAVLEYKRNKSIELSSHEHRQAVVSRIVRDITEVLGKHDITRTVDIIRCSRSITEMINETRECRLEASQVLDLFDAFLRCAKDEIRPFHERYNKPKASSFNPDKLKALMSALSVAVAELTPESHSEFVEHFRERRNALTSKEILSLTKHMLRPESE
jgi:hypothetical protein